MKIRIALVALIAGLIPVGLIAPAGADVTYTEQVKVKDETPEVGRYTVRYKNYSEKMRLCMEDGYCEFLGYRKAEGQLGVKLTTFKIVDGRRSYDYFLLDVDIVNGDREGTSKNGWAKVAVSNYGPGLVDQSNTKSASYNDDRDCKAIGVGLSTPWPIVSASMDLGHVTFCDKGASYSHSFSSGISTYFADHTRQITHVSSQRVVKVREGKKPSFKVVLTIPVDKCTKGGGGLASGNCVAYDNKTYTKNLYIGTFG